MKFPQVSIADWRTQVEKELAGVPFDKALVHTTAEGLRVEPLYTAAELPPVPRRQAQAPFLICMPYDGDDAARAEDLAGGAEAIWDRKAGVVRIQASGASWRVVNEASAAALAAPATPAAPVLISTLTAHAAGADAADELAAALSLLAARLDAGAAPSAIAVQLAVGRDTFGELCKLRTLRVVWQKLLAAAGAGATAPALVHAVASTRTASVRDPWVNMLRGTTEAFAAILGGADLVTPIAYDEAAGPASALGRRVARNTALVLREESLLGRVVDPAAGSYYLETRTDALAREAWKRFRALEAEGGVAALAADGRWQARLEAAWKKRQDALARRKEPVLGVSEFANLDEKPLPRAAAPAGGHRDAEAFEALRDRADALAKSDALPTLAIVTLGPAAEHRARLGWTHALFAVGGLRARTTTSTSERATIACLCGSDERYATDAADAARALKAAGCARVLVAGRPGALEASLREAGVDGFVFAGCDVAATLADLLEVRS